MTYLFIFRRDFRVFDNVALQAMLRDVQKQKTKNEQKVMFLFVYNRNQICPDRNPYFSNNAMQFLVESLRDLEEQIHELIDRKTFTKIIVNDLDEEVRFIEEILAQEKEKENKLNVFFNRDLTPFARERDDRLLQLGKETEGLSVHSFEDYTLFPVFNEDAEAAIRRKSKEGQSYKVFSFFYKKRKELHSFIPKPEKETAVSKSIQQNGWDAVKMNAASVIEKDQDDAFYSPNRDLAVRGGRKQGLKILHAIERGEFKNYDTTRDCISVSEGTTRLSAYLKFGCLSIREVYWAIHAAHSIDHALIRELYFRDFYYALGWERPDMLRRYKYKYTNHSSTRENKTKEKKHRNAAFLNDLDDKLWTVWKDDPEGVARWKDGRTGAPFVDAAMRQLNSEGFMHNRGRMVVAMYLTKYMLVDWRVGEQYFATRLVDYDPIQNSAGWQWSASIGTDAAPYFRIMSPFAQSKKYDPDAIYMKRWIPELEGVSANALHKWDQKEVREKIYKSDASIPETYRNPHVQDHSAASKKAVEVFRSKFKKRET